MLTNVLTDMLIKPVNTLLSPINTRLHMIHAVNMCHNYSQFRISLINQASYDWRFPAASCGERSNSKNNALAVQFKYMLSLYLHNAHNVKLPAHRAGLAGALPVKKAHPASLSRLHLQKTNCLPGSENRLLLPE